MPNREEASCAVHALRQAVDNLNAAVVAQDFEAITKTDHHLRNAAMAAVGGLPMSPKKIDETESVLGEALNAVRSAAKCLEAEKRSKTAKLRRQERVRLVYSKKGT